MDLKKALELQIEYYGKDGTVRVDENGYLCLNDLNAYFPNKRLDHWMENADTKDLIESVKKILNTRNSGYLKMYW